MSPRSFGHRRHEPPTNGSLTVVGAEDRVVVDRPLGCHEISHQRYAEPTEVRVGEGLHHSRCAEPARLGDDTIEVHGLARHLRNVRLHELIGGNFHSAHHTVLSGRTAMAGRSEDPAATGLRRPRSCHHVFRRVAPGGSTRVRAGTVPGSRPNAHSMTYFAPAGRLAVREK